MFKESTINAAQNKTFSKFLTKFYQGYPGGQVIGWGEISGDARNPGFDVSLYISSFNKKKSGELTSIVMNDVAVMQGAFTNTFLEPGDHIRMEVEGLGILENPVTERV